MAIKEVRTGYSGALRYQFRDPLLMDAMRKMLEFKKNSIQHLAWSIQVGCQHEIKDNGKCIECGAVEYQETPG